MGDTTSPESGSVVDRQEAELALPFFFHSTPGPIPGWEPSGIYQRVDEPVLGDNDDEGQDAGNVDSLDVSRCFNCGEADHKVPDCPVRPNRDLISLSRQYYQFYQGMQGLRNWQRIHIVEAWRQQRLDWLEEFEPGKITGELLQDALAFSNDELLKNISAWGYPPGWVSERHPQERVKARISNGYNESSEDGDDADTPFEIHGEDGTAEKISFQFRENDVGTDVERPDTTAENPSSSLVPVRWANYPPSYFSSQHLVLYTPPPNPNGPGETWDNTIFDNTEMYLHHHSPDFYCFQPPPPPPSDEPPPLPPSSPPPPIPPSRLQEERSSTQNPGDPCSPDSHKDSESDMDLSDSE